MNEIFCVIMAGGRGERFWPRSRKDNPKQMLDFLGDGALLEQTVLRLYGFIPAENILIITNQDYVTKIRGVCREIPPENIVGEPFSKNTAPCVALAAGIVKARAKTADPVLLILPSDHYIINRNAMIDDIRLCSQYAVEHDVLGTIGVTPDYPSVEYGYIECGTEISGKGEMFSVKCFREKPCLEKATEYFEQGNFKWNSGMFVFPLRTLCREMAQHTPALLDLAETVAGAWGTEQFLSVLKEKYFNVEKISIDYAIMEKSSGIVVKAASFGWDDVGNWESLRKYLTIDENQNAVSAKVSLLDCRNCIVYSEDESFVIAGIDLNDILLVKSADAILACPVKSSGKIKTLLTRLRESDDLEKYL